jgi:hypothetical protein
MKVKKIKTIHCKDVAKHLCENLDQKLNSRFCRQVRKHLQECPDCTADLDSLKKTISLFRNISSPSVPDSVHKKLFAVLKLKP